MIPQQQVYGEASGGAVLGTGPMSMTERLQLRRDTLAKQLEETEAALAALKDNPEVARAVDAISKLGHF